MAKIKTGIFSPVLQKGNGDQNQSLLSTWKNVSPLWRLTESVETLRNYSKKQAFWPLLTILLRFARKQIATWRLSFLICHLFIKFQRNHTRVHQLSSKCRCEKKLLRSVSGKVIAWCIIKNHLSGNFILQWTFYNPSSLLQPITRYQGDKRETKLLHHYLGFQHQNNPFGEIYSSMMNLENFISDKLGLYTNFKKSYK